MGREFRYKLVRGRMNAAGDVLMLGVFDGSLHEGTDKLSMAVQPDLLAFLDVLEAKGKKVVIVFEGDRLFNGALFDKVEEDCSLFVLTTNRQAENIRARGTNQTDAFLLSKKTKVANICKRFKHTPIENNHPESMEEAAEVIVKEIKRLLS